MTPRAWLFAKIFALLLPLLSVACKPEIGDECELSTDCSATGDRLCDTTQPGGYCTMFNCERGSCPEEAVCIGYGNTLSTAPACQDPQASRRLQRTFCLKSCESDDDCRGGYDCIDMRGMSAWGAIVVERAGKSGKVCAVPFRGEPPDSELPPGPNVCSGGDWDGGPRPEPDAGAAGDGAAADSAADGGDGDGSDGSDAAQSADAAADALVE